MEDYIPEKTSTQALEQYTADKPLLSSLATDWSDLLVRTYQEPDRYHLTLPAVPDPLVIVQYSGADSALERRLGGTTARTRVGKGSVWFIPAEEASEWQWRNQSPEKIASVHLHLRRELLVRVAEQAAEAAPRFIELLDRFPVFDPLIEHLALALKGELETGTPGGKLYGDAAGQMLAVQLLRHHTTVPYRVKEYKGGLPPYRLRQVEEYMRAHLEEVISLDRLAELSGLSTYHFARLFKQSTGESPYQLLIRLRVEQAQQLLRETALPVTQIAFRVGYRSLNPFFEAFHRHTGTTPLNYRMNA